MSVITANARDSGVLTWRNLMNVRRQPDLLLGATLQPIMFVLLFAYVFGGSIGQDPDAYREFLMGGIFAQTVAFNSAYTTLGMAADLEKGVIDRFRSLPMSRAAVLLGRTFSDLVVSAIGLIVMSVCGLIVGWRIRGSFVDAVLGFAILLLFSFAMSWIGAWIGMLSGNVQVAQSAGFIWMFPVSFVSSAFVSAASMPGPLKVVADWNPVTAVADAARELFGNPRPGILEASRDSWPAQQPVLWAVLSCVIILVIFMPVAVAKYRKVASK
ncbi:ABC-type multidrug transport system, permease component [Alloactinosynnema sp. L-07]|uniref:ABC transporter permease n=1 Tax=Alloactinosynnema sp. L-07 TaxID=1653480 RepID=UPI00065EF358|nr:ABC transporter permease [Alloactinosynnema sp. L-07]CRK60856.1 ABC-type multidrug transport system, permease component [Alloactinosynnema sp. L-07]